MKPLSIALNWVGTELHEGYGAGGVTYVQCKAIQNWCNEYPLHNEYILIKWKNGL
jgi:hypothetical protein